jgi:thiamine kinase-like enzyme
VVAVQASSDKGNEMNIDPTKYAEKLSAQRNAALDQVAILSAAVDTLQSEIEELKKKLEELKPS